MTRRPAAIGTLLIGLALASGAIAQETSDFMPKGGKTLLVEALGTPLDAAALREIATQTRDVEAWRALFADNPNVAAGAALDTLANYLAVNMPVAPEALDQAAGKGDITTALPPDGRELAWNYCQFCHSFFAGYLTIDRDVQGWRSTFETPFHREMELTATERETFSRYSAINMPMKFEDVPEDLRF